MKKNYNLNNKATNFFFLSIIFENNFFFFYKNYLFSKNIKYLVLNDSRVLNSIFFFCELKPIMLVDLIGFDDVFLKNFNYFLHKNVNILHFFYSLKLDYYLYIMNIENKLNSINSFFKNSIWLEREAAEMFNLKFNNQIDCRNLLLEYGFKKGILLKKYYVFDTLNLKSDYYNKINYQNNLFNSI